jgi:hypothetical protein
VAEEGEAEDDAEEAEQPSRLRRWLEALGDLLSGLLGGP